MNPRHHQTVVAHLLSVLRDDLFDLLRLQTHDLTHCTRGQLPLHRRNEEKPVWIRTNPTSHTDVRVTSRLQRMQQYKKMT